MVCDIHSAVTLRRSDKRKDRVEISPEMLIEVRINMPIFLIIIPNFQIFPLYKVQGTNSSMCCNLPIIPLIIPLHLVCTYIQLAPYEIKLRPTLFLQITLGSAPSVIAMPSTSHEIMILVLYTFTLRLLDSILSLNLNASAPGKEMFGC